MCRAGEDWRESIWAVIRYHRRRPGEYSTGQSAILIMPSSSLEAKWGAGIQDGGIAAKLQGSKMEALLLHYRELRWRHCSQITGIQDGGVTVTLK